MPERHYKFGIEMICTGCSGAVERVLKKLDGVKSYDVDLDKKTADVIIDDSLVYETLRDKIKKTGKTMTKADKIENGKEIPMPIHDPLLVSE